MSQLVLDDQLDIQVIMGKVARIQKGRMTFWHAGEKSVMKLPTSGKKGR